MEELSDKLRNANAELCKEMAVFHAKERNNNVTCAGLAGLVATFGAGLMYLSHTLNANIQSGSVTNVGESEAMIGYVLGGIAIAVGIGGVVLNLREIIKINRSIREYANNAQRYLDS